MAHRAKTQAGITRAMRREELRGLSHRVHYPPMHVADVEPRARYRSEAQRPLIRLGHFSGNIYCVTRYEFVDKGKGSGLVTALRKYDVTDQVLAIVKAWSRFHNARKRQERRGFRVSRLQSTSRYGRAPGPRK